MRERSQSAHKTLIEFSSLKVSENFANMPLSVTIDFDLTGSIFFEASDVSDAIGYFG